MDSLMKGMTASKPAGIGAPVIIITAVPGGISAHITHIEKQNSIMFSKNKRFA